MKKFYSFFFVCLIFSSSFLFSQKDGGSTNNTQRSGNTAILFSVNQLTPGAYGGGIGGKMYFTSSMAGRLGLGLTMGSDVTQILLAPSITIDFLKSNPLTFYFGGGLFVDSKSDRGLDFTLGGGVGAEWFLDKNVSLSAEYNAINLTISSPKVGESTTTFGIGSYGQAILSFYF